MTKWGHNELALDLANHLVDDRRMVWCDMQLGPAGSPRPDVWTLDKSYTRTKAVAYEIKVTKADFRSDVTSGKWQKYLGFSSCVYFACPAGLISKGDLPDRCGLIVRGESGWRALRAPVVGECEIDWVVARKLLIDGERQRVRAQPRSERSSWGAMEKIAKKWGQEAATVLADIEQAKRTLAHLQDQAESEREAAAQRRQDIQESIKRQTASWRRDLCSALGIAETEDVQEIASAWRTLRDLVANTSGQLQRGLEYAARNLDDAVRRVEQARGVLSASEEVRA